VTQLVLYSIADNPFKEGYEQIGKVFSNLKIDSLIDWYLTPPLAVFQLYRGGHSKKPCLF
jgi:hypothetical protein